MGVILVFYILEIDICHLILVISDSGFAMEAMLVDIYRCISPLKVVFLGHQTAFFDPKLVFFEPKNSTFPAFFGPKRGLCCSLTAELNI